MPREKHRMIELLLAMVFAIILYVGLPVIFHIVVPWAVGIEETKKMLAPGILLLGMFLLLWSVAFWDELIRIRNKKC